MLVVLCGESGGAWIDWPAVRVSVICLPSAYSTFSVPRSNTYTMAGGCVCMAVVVPGGIVNSKSLVLSVSPSTLTNLGLVDEKSCAFDRRLIKERLSNAIKNFTCFIFTVLMWTIIHKCGLTSKWTEVIVVTNWKGARITSLRKSMTVCRNECIVCGKG